MRIIKISKEGNYTHHGIGYTEHDGYGGTADNRMSIKSAIAVELGKIAAEEDYQVEIDGVNKGIFKKASGL